MRMIVCIFVLSLMGCRGSGNGTFVPDLIEDDKGLSRDNKDVLSQSETSQEIYEQGFETTIDTIDVIGSAQINMICTEDKDCSAVCGSGKCVEGKCSIQVLQGYCLHLDGEIGTCYKSGQGLEGYPCLLCNPKFVQTRLSPIVLWEDFEVTPPKYALLVKDLTSGGIVWNVSETRAKSGSKSLYFGDPNLLTYGNGQHVASSAVFKDIYVPKGVSPLLRFYVYLDTESTEGYDILSVNIEDNEGVEVVWNSDMIGGTTKGFFIPIEIDLSEWSGKVISLAFVFDSIDSGINGFEGAYIDDIVITTGCCAEDIDCEDGNPCSVDKCTGFGKACSYQEKQDCCQADSDCNDNNLCTKDSCKKEGGICLFELIPECCHTDKDCDDKNECTKDICPNDGAICKHLPLCCLIDSDCISLDKCLKGKCNFGKCEFIDTCCKSDSECDDKDSCTIDICNMGDCIHKPAYKPGCCFPIAFSAYFDGSDEGFSTDPAVDGVGWYVVQSGQNMSPPGALYYGDPSKKNFDNGKANKGGAMSSFFDIFPDSETTLRFYLWMDTESGEYYDSLKVYLVEQTEGEDKKYLIWSKSNIQMKKWIEIKTDISAFAGRKVALLFYFDSGDSYANSGEGVYIDNITVESACMPKKCVSQKDCISQDPCKTGVCSGGQCVYADSCCKDSSECDDGNVCTDDKCVNGKCQFNVIKGCCVTSMDCNDSNPCTEDVCPNAGSQCEHKMISGCCITAMDCDDNDKCTQDICTSKHECEHKNLCCNTDEDCDDKDDKCTIDKCIDQFCKYEPTYAEGCCTPNIFYAGFEGGDTQGFELSPPDKGVGWQVFSEGKASKGSFALYYGNPNTMDFDNGSSNKGYATSPKIILPKGSGIELSFDIFMDTEQGSNYDKMSVLYKDEVGEWTIWDKGKLSAYGMFVNVKINMNAFAGKEGHIVFFFDTVDSVANYGEGVYLDEINIVSTCVPVPCVKDTECSDGHGFTKDICSGGVCSYEFLGQGVSCISSSDCDDNDPCTTDFCLLGKCKSEPIDCDDGDACTYDYCDMGKCVNEYDLWCWYE